VANSFQHCGTHLWKELPTQRAQRYQWLIDQRKSVAESAHLCTGRDFKLNQTSFQKIVSILGGSSIMSLWNNSCRPILPVSLSPAQATQSATPIQMTQPTSTPTNNPGVDSGSSQVHGAGTSAQRTSDNVIIFGVKGSRRTPGIAQIKTEEHKEDKSFFLDLWNRYKELRGFWRNWFSVWQFNYCDFVKVGLGLEPFYE
jgi:hypothetical protein